MTAAFLRGGSRQCTATDYLCNRRATFFLPFDYSCLAYSRDRSVKKPDTRVAQGAGMRVERWEESAYT